MKLLLSILAAGSLIGQDKPETTVNRLSPCSKSCQICIDDDSIEICKFYKKCPEPRPRECVQ